MTATVAYVVGTANPWGGASSWSQPVALMLGLAASTLGTAYAVHLVESQGAALASGIGALVSIPAAFLATLVLCSALPAGTDAAILYLAIPIVQGFGAAAAVSLNR